MLVYQFILPHLVPFGAVVARFAGLFIFAPVLGSLSIPVRVKALLAVGSALVVYPTLNHAVSIPAGIDMIGLAPLVVTEALIGLSIGLIAGMPIVSVQMGGLLMGQQMGLGVASLFNPAIDTDADIAGQILLYAALGAFLAMGGLEAMHTALVESFAHVPIGALTIGQAPLDLVAGLTQSGFELAIRVSAPVVCILMLETAATGFLMKTVPQLNILSFGFPLKILLGLVALVSAIYIIDGVIRGDLDAAAGAMLDWVRSL